MTVTRTLLQKSYQASLVINENNAITSDPSTTGAVSTVTAGASVKYDGNGSPNATMDGHAKYALTAGAGSIDLTAFVDAILGTQSFSGKKAMHIQVSCPSTNAGVLTVAPGASNGYTGWVGADGLKVGPGDTQILGPLNSTIAVDGTHKILDLSGTGTDVLNIVVLFG